MRIQNRRTQSRPRVHFPAELRAREQQGHPKAFYGRLSCQACDVSVSGARLIAVSEELVPEGAAVIITLRPSRFRRSFALKGTVRWGHAGTEGPVQVCGVEFDPHPSLALRRWHRFMLRFLKKRGIRA